MGEAKKKANSLRKWRDSLTDDEKVVADVASQVFDRLVVPNQATGMCYRLAFFLTELLAQQHSLQVEPIVGYVNDGTSDIMPSHAWIETAGKRTDLSLAFTEYSDAQLPGEVLILDRIARPGMRYTYSRDQTPEALQALQNLQSDPRFGHVVAQKEVEHAAMLARSKSAELRRAYLDSAPGGFDYTRLASIVANR